MPTLFTDMFFGDGGSTNRVMMRKAKALAHVLDNITIFITDQAQLVGYMGSGPHTIAWRIDGASMVNEEVYNEPGIHEEPEEESLKKVAELYEYWAGETAVDKLASLLDPEDAVKFMSGAIGWGDADLGLRVLDQGLRVHPDRQAGLRGHHRGNRAQHRRGGGEDHREVPGRRFCPCTRRFRTGRP